MRPNIIIPLVIVFVCALAAAGMFALNTAQASGYGCPSDWPDASSSGESGNGQIDFEGFYTDEDGDEWYIIRSTDSNGTTSVRAYPADDRYDAGYRSGSPAETCYLIVRRAGETEDAAQPERVQLREEQEESDTPPRTPSQTPGTGGGTGGTGGGGTGQGNALAIIAASLEIMRHSGALVAADLPTSEQEIRQYAGMVAGRETAMNAQLAILAANSQSSSVGEIRTLVNRLVSNAKAIQAGRPALLRAVAMEVRERNALTRTNQTHLFPNTEATLDEGFYNLVTSVDSVSTDDILYYWHLDSLTATVTLGSTFLQVASLMQDPTFVARIREGYASIAGRMERDIAYLQEEGDAALRRDVLGYANAAYNAGTGSNNYFDRLEGRLTLVANERARVENNDENLARLRDEIGRLAADVLDRQHPIPETTPEVVVENPGVTASAIKFGQSADFSGGSMELGTGMRLGIQAAFQEAGPSTAGH